jgi:phage shock protein B
MDVASGAIGLVFLIVAMTLLIPIAAILGVVAIIMAIVRAMTGGSRRTSGRGDAEEARIMQEIHRGLSKMESRMENLEAILDTHEEKAGHSEQRL